MAKIEIDYFESIKLLESVMYSQTALSGSIKDKFIHDWYHCFNAKEKQALYNWLKRVFNRDNEDELINQDIDRILARYNPNNQFSVTVEKGELKEKVSTYLFDDIYYTGIRYQYCEPSTIKKVENIENYGEIL